MPQSYSVIDKPSCEASAINDDGTIVGRFGRNRIECEDIEINKTFLYDGSSSVEVSGGETSYNTRRDINNLGDTLITLSYDSSKIIIGNGETINLDFDGYKINDSRSVVGRNKVYINGTVLSQNPSYYFCGINNNNEAVGFNTSGIYQPIIWKNGITTYLESFPPSHSGALAINDNGIVVGYHAIQAAFWGIDHKLNILGDFTPHSINNKGQIVGDAAGGMRAILYDDGQIIDLNSFLSQNSEWERLAYAYDINNKGQIVGYGYLKGNDQPYAFLANPIPEPMSLLIFSIGLLVIRKHKK